MKRLIAATMVVSLLSLGIVGCSGNTSSSKTETKFSTPGGTTTITTEKEVRKTGDNPPPVRP